MIFDDSLWLLGIGVTELLLVISLAALLKYAAGSEAVPLVVCFMVISAAFWPLTWAVGLTALLVLAVMQILPTPPGDET